MDLPLHLTSDEAAMLSRIDPSIVSLFQVQPETLSFTDTPERQRMRFDLLRLHDPVLMEAKEKLSSVQSDAEFQSALKTLDFSKISNPEFSRLLFALGPDALGLMIQDVLERASTRDDIELVAALAGLRHLMLESLIEADF